MNPQQAAYTRLNLDSPRTAHSLVRNLLLKNASSSSLILDVGCADGLVYKLTAFGRNVTGVEYDEVLAARARNHYGSVILHDLDRERLPLPDSSFDIIVAADVIEHCKRDTVVLADLARLLKKDGIIIISLPNVAQFWVRLHLLIGRFEYSTAGVLCREHLHFYTEKTMKRLVNESGLKIREIHGAGTLYSYIPVWRKFLCPQMIIVAEKP
jgi:2-polyprenyl-3-methyl-5-hydroxy-6-metoxy-1,4-benzoquinol methylase